MSASARLPSADEWQEAQRTIVALQKANAELSESAAGADKLQADKERDQRIASSKQQLKWAKRSASWKQEKHNLESKLNELQAHLEEQKQQMVSLQSGNPDWIQEKENLESKCLEVQSCLEDYKSRFEQQTQSLLDSEKQIKELETLNQQLEVKAEEAKQLSQVATADKIIIAQELQESRAELLAITTSTKAEWTDRETHFQQVVQDYEKALESKDSLLGLLKQQVQEGLLQQKAVSNEADSIVPEVEALVLRISLF